MSINKSYIDEIYKKLKSLQVKEGKTDLLYNSLFTLIFILIIWIIYSTLELLFNISSSGRTILFFVYSGLIVGFFLLKVIYPFIIKLTKFDYNKLAIKIGDNLPLIKDELADVLQLAKEKNKSQNSNLLIEKAFEVVYTKVKNEDFNRFIDLKPLKKIIRFTLYITAIFILLFSVFGELREASVRLINFNKEFIPPAKYLFFISPGNAKVTRGADVDIKINIKGSDLSKVDLYLKYIDQTEYQKTELEAKGDNEFNYKISKILTSLDYYVYADGLQSDVYRINVVNKPYITQFDLNINYPIYAKLQPSMQRDNGNISALKGTNVGIKLFASKELKKAYILFSDTTQIELKVKNSYAEGSFRVVKNIDYKIMIEDLTGNVNQNSVNYNISVIEDFIPELEIIAPNKNINLPEDNKIAFIMKIKDDYGFSKLTLNYKLTESKFMPIENPDKKEFVIENISFDKIVKEQEVYYIWNLSPMLLAIEDVVSYYIEVFDNDNVSGPKSAKSALFTVRVPGLNEVFAEADHLQNEAEKKLVETLKEAEKLNKEIEKINDALKQDKKEITWEEKEKIQQALDKYNDLAKKTEEIKQQLSETQNKLEEKNLLSEETLQKYMELQKLMSELNNEEMKKMFDKMNQMMKNMDRTQVQNSFEDLKKNEENFQKSIERTLNLLKRMKVEQKIDELVKRTEDLENKQNELAEQTEKSNLNNQKEKDALQKKQNEISKDMEKLKKEMKDLQESMQELKDMPKDEMDKASDEMEKQENEELSEDAKKDIDKNQKNSAMQKQKKISKNMKSMNKMMQQMKQSMEMQNQMQVYSDMLKTIDNILMLSKEQEKIKNMTSDLPFNSQKFNELTREQSEKQRDLDKINQQLNDLAQKTFAISPEMGKALGDARANMNQALQAMQGKNGFAAGQSQGKAMGNLNEAAMMLKSSMDAMMEQNGGGQGGGMMSLMQQFKQLSEQQMQMNQQTMQMMQGNGQPDMQQMQRLANQQDMIKKSLEELNKEAKESGQSKKLAANMDKILEDMKEVVSDMRTQKDFDENIVKKQDKILSRLLDAQRSINDRDFEKQRESNSGKNVIQNSPEDIKLNNEIIDRIQDELLKAIKEGYSKDYEEIIRNYYELLRKGK